MNDPIKYDLEKLAAVIRRLPKRVATVAENFSKQRFREQGWKNTSLQPWAKRKNDKDPQRAVLVKSGRLRLSIKARASGMNVIVSSDVPYAEAHNEGFKGAVTDKVGSHTRKAHKRKGYTRKDGKKIGAVTVAAHSVRSFTRKRNVNLPKRQFIGPSAALDKEVMTLISAEIQNALK